MCGRNSALVRARIEGTFLNVCKVCAKLGEVLKGETPQVQKKEPKIEILEIMPDFADKIRSAREDKKLTRKELAEKLREKEKVIARIEKGMRPTRQIAEKLEKVLGISLFYEEKTQKLQPVKTEAMTIGDIVEIRMKKKA